MDEAALDPDAQALIARIAAAGRKPYFDLNLAEARTAYAQACREVGLAPVQAVVRTPVLRQPFNGSRLRLYRPPDSHPGEKLPGVLFAHGGGWVLGDLDTHDTICRRLAQKARVALLAVDYRRSPETPFPGAVEDVFEALKTLSGAAESLGVDPGRLAVVGDSAGASLVTVAALLARDAGGPALRAQILFYPVTDLAEEAASYVTAGSGLVLTAESMRWFRTQYLKRPEDGLDWRASPLRAPNLEDAPESLIITCGRDPLCDEGRAYATRLEAEGVAVSTLHLADQIHGFLTSGGVLRQATPVLDMAAAWLKHRLGK